MPAEATSTTETRKQMLRALTRQGEAIEALIASGSLDIAAGSLNALEQGSGRYLVALRARVRPAAPSEQMPVSAPAAVTTSAPQPAAAVAAAVATDDPFAGRI